MLFNVFALTLISPSIYAAATPMPPERAARGAARRRAPAPAARDAAAALCRYASARQR